MAINWDLARSQPNIVGNALQGYRVGREMGRERGRQSALARYATDETGALNALIANGDVDTANALTGYQTNRDTLSARRAGGALAATGDYAGAARAAAADPQTAAQYAQLAQADLERHYALAQRGAAALRQAAGLPTPEARRAFMEPFRNEAVAMGIDFDRVDWGNAENLRAGAEAWMGLEQQARTELARREAALREQDMATDNAREDRRLGIYERGQEAQIANEGRRLDLQRDRYAAEDERYADEARREGETPNAVIGAILAKQARGEPLTAGEQAALETYRANRAAADPYGYGGGGADEYGAAAPASPAPAAAPPAPARGPARASGNGGPVRRQVRTGTVRIEPDANGVYRPRSAADMESVPIGARFVNPADGRVLTRNR